MATTRLIAEKGLHQAIARAYEQAQSLLSQETIDDMAMPSYLGGWALSRRVAWGKLPQIVSAAALAPKTQVLDFGCGTGILLATLCAGGRHVFATDTELDIARSVANDLDLPNVEFLDADTWAEHIPDTSLETVVAANVLEHVHDRKTLLEAMAQKLTPTGRIVICGPTENRLYRLGRWIAGFSGDYHVSSVSDVQADARAIGLRRASLKRWPLPGPFCLYQIAVFCGP